MMVDVWVAWTWLDIGKPDVVHCGMVSERKGLSFAVDVPIKRVG